MEEEGERGKKENRADEYRKGKEKRKKKRKECDVKRKGRVFMKSQWKRKSYPSDVSDGQWERLASYIPQPVEDAPREAIERREIVNGIFYVLRTGCSWRQMPHDLPNGKTVYHYFWLWSRDGTWEKALSALRKEVRMKMGRNPEASAVIIDSQSIKTSAVRGSERGYDGGKKIWGRKRHVLVDTQGFLMAVKVHTASLVDSQGAPLL